MEKAAVFLRLLHADDKEAALRAAVEAANAGEKAAEVFHVDPTSFEQVPGSPFAYWVSEPVRRLFRELSAFESDGRFTRVGLQTSDDFRFIRCWWEVAPQKLLDASTGPRWQEGIPAFQNWCRQQTFQGRRWIPIAKGGAFARYFDEPQMVVNLENDAQDLRDFEGSVIRNPDYYFRPGLTWPLRGIRLSAQAVPAGACFSVAGKFATTEGIDELFSLLGLMNSVAFDYLVGFFAGKVGGVQYEVGLIGKVPVPKAIHDDTLIPLSQEASRAAAFQATFDECRHLFAVPRLAATEGITLAERLATWQARVADAELRLAAHQREIDDIAFRLYGIDGEDRRMIEAGVSEPVRGTEAAGEVEEDES